MKRICFLTSTIFTIGGIQRCISILSNKLLEEGYKVHIICTDSKHKIDYSLYNLSDNVEIEFIPRKKIENYLFFYTYFIKKICIVFSPLQKCTHLLGFCYYKKNFLQNKKIINYINQNNIDVVIGAGHSYLLLLASLRKKISAKLIGWQHGSCEAYFNYKKNRIYSQKYLYSDYIKRLDEYIVLTKNDCDWIKTHFNYNAKCIYNPKSFISKEKSSLKSKKFIAVGRYDYIKGFDRLIDSFNIFSKSNEEWILQIIGDGPEKENLENKIKSYHLENRVFLVSKTNNIKKYYLDSSIYLLTSFYECLPMVLLEACECGLPIISYDLPSSVEQFSICSLLAKNGDILEFSNLMLKLSNDSKLLKNLSIKAIKNAENYDINVIIKKWKKIL